MKHVLACLWVIAFGLVLLALPGLGQTQKTTIEAIVENPGQFANSSVEFEGLVDQYVAAPTSTSYYMIRGNYGQMIKVNTADPSPEINHKYRVSGIVYIDPVDNSPFVSEKSKSLLDGTVNPPPPPPPPPPDYWLYLLVGLLVVLIGAFIYFLTQRSKGEQPAVAGAATVMKGPGTQISDVPTMSTSNEYKTVRIAVSSPKTLKFIPGQLIITSGEDKGKSFRIAGYPTAEGSIVSIGRDAVSGDRAYAHIQIDNRFSTVSRKQAELISREGKLLVRNLSETNLTQVDGIELKPGQCAELKPGSTMRTGELEFQYKV